MELKRNKPIHKSLGLGIKKSKEIENKGQKYVILNNDLHNCIANINDNFDFKSFDKNTLKDVEIVSISIIMLYIIL
jgi:hypothetical protein